MKGRKKINIELSGVKEKTTADVDTAIKQAAREKAVKEKKNLSIKIEELLYDYATR